MAATTACLALAAGCTSGGSAPKPVQTAAAGTAARTVQTALTAAVQADSVDFSGQVTTAAGSGTLTGRAQFGSVDTGATGGPQDAVTVTRRSPG